MRSGPKSAGLPARMRGWALVCLAGAVLAMCAAVLLLGQSPAAATAAAEPAQASVNSTQTSAKPTSSTPAQAAAQGSQTPATPAQAAVSASQTAGAAGSDAQSPQIAQETADLLKMATELQSEMNKTKPNTLSLAVVRKANEIEQLAKKMRSRP